MKDVLISLVKQGVRLSVNGDKLVAEGNLKALGKDTKLFLRDNKDKIVAYIKARQGAGSEVIPRRAAQAELKLSHAQQRLWFIDQMDGSSSQYNISAAFSINGDLNKDALQRALNEVVARHEVLRTVFITQDNGEAKQVIKPALPVTLNEIDLSLHSAEERERQIHKLAKADAEKNFDLSADLMLRAALVIETHNRHVLLFTMHHIASDGWSIDVLTREVVALYTAYSQGKDSPLPPLSIQYADFSIWQREWLSGAVLDQQLDYWHKQLTGIPVVHSLPMDHERPSKPNFVSRVHLQNLDKSLSDKLNDLSQAEEVTLFMTLQSAFALLLSRFGNETDIVMGTAVANRTQVELNPLIGFFVNTLVLRSDLSGNPAFSEFLQQSKLSTLGAFEYQHIPFEMLVERLQPERNLSYSPLFQVMFVLQNTDNVQLDLPGLKMQVLEQQVEVAKFDLTLAIEQSDEGLTAHWEYRRDLFEAGTIESLAASFEVLLQGIVAAPKTQVMSLPLVSDADIEHFARWRDNALENAQNSQGYPQNLMFDGCYATVRDSQMQILPKGAIGELVLAGEGVHRGPDETKLVADPVNGEQQIYPTGELVHYRADGQLNLLGQINRQVRLNGFKFSLEQIEKVIGSNEHVDTVKVVLVNDRLAAYVVPAAVQRDEETFVKGLHQWLNARLEKHMQPQGFKVVEQLSEVMPAPNWLAKVEFSEPKTTAQIALAGIWCDLLGVEQVSLNDNFFALGGNSLSSVRLEFAIMEHFGIEVSIRELFECPELAEQAKLLDVKEQFLDLPEIEPIVREGDLTLSYAQQRLWFIDQLEPGSAQYNMPNMLRLKGPMNRTALERAFNEIVSRHEVLRTVYTTADNGDAIQRITPIQAIDFAKVDLRNESNPQAKVHELGHIDAQKPFDLQNDLMLRASLLMLADDEHVLLFNMHHIASDGWSMGVLIEEIGVLYRAFCNDEHNPLAPLALQYADFAYWQRHWLSGETLDSQLNYWTTQLADIPQIHTLPLDKIRPDVQSHAGAVYSHQLDASLTAKLNDVSQLADATLFMTMQAAFSVLLSRYSNETDIVIGTPVANRSQAALSGLIGFFVNTLVLRNDLSVDQTFNEYLAATRQMALEAYEHQHIPFEMLVDKLHPERSFSYSPLFQVLFMLQQDDEFQMNLEGLSVSPVKPNETQAKFDLSLVIGSSEQGMTVNWEYCTALFDEATIERMAASFEVLLTAIVDEPHTKIWQLSIVPQADLKLLQQWEAVQTGYPRDVSIHDLFAKQVAQYPQKVAMVCEQQQFTYQQLDGKSNQVARLLIQRGVTRGDLVGLCVTRSADLVVGMLAILKAGAAYVPLDSKYPQERLSKMLNGSGLKLILSQTRVLESTPIDPQIAITLDDTRVYDHFSAEPLDPIAQPDDLAYVMFTSGSTGVPKGVMVSHLNIVRLVINCDYMPLDENTIFMQSASISFDLATLEVWAPILNGGHVVLYPDDIIDMKLLNETIVDHQVNSIWLTAGLFNQWSQHLPDTEHLKYVLAGGDVFDPQAVARVYDKYPQVTCINGYGPTENTTFSSCHTIPRDFDRAKPIPLGKYIRGSSGEVRQANGAKAGIGMIGELWVGGDGVAHGYHNQPELTAQKFLIDDEAMYSRTYCTGDLVYYQSDGTLAFVGRVDEQVKIRGFRIEPGEIVSTLTLHDEVEEAYILVSDVGSSKQLIAYLVPSMKVPSKKILVTTAEDEAAFINGVKDWLKGRFPDYMIPYAFVVMDVLPLNANGKVDRQALPKPSLSAQFKGGLVAPTTDTQRKLVEIWCQLLSLEEASINVSFFDYGGHSLLLTSLTSLVNQAFEVDLTLRDLFENNTIEKISVIIDNAATVGHLKIPVVSREQNLPLSFAQQRIWFVDQLQGSEHYNLQGMLSLTGNLNMVALERAIIGVIERHEVLRTRFVEHNGEAYQVVKDTSGFEVQQVSLTDKNADQQHKEVIRLAQIEQGRAFDLSHDVMLRACIFTLADDSWVLLLTTNHIAFDGVSMGIFTEDLGRMYSALVQGKENPLPSLSIQYADFSKWQRNWLSGDVLEGQLNYWRDYLADLPVVHKLPLDKPRPAKQTYVGASYSHLFDADLTARINAFCKTQDVTLYMLLQSAMSVMLSRYSNETDIVMGTPIAGRTAQQSSELIGFFVNTLVLRSDLSGNPQFSALLEVNKQHIIDAFTHQHIPFEMLVEALNPQRSFSHNALYQVVMAVQNFDAGELALPGLALKPYIDADKPLSPDYELALHVIELPDGIEMAWSCNTDVFNISTMERFAQSLQVLLEGIMAAPHTPIDALPILSEIDQDCIGQQFNAALSDYQKDAAIHQLFEQQVFANGHLRALVFEDESLSYQQLNEKANQVAHFLAQGEVDNETLVGLCAESSMALVIGALGILKAGGSCLPINPQWPEERIEEILEQSELEWMLTQAELMAEMPFEDLRVMPLDGPMGSQLLGRFGTDNPEVEALSPQAFVLYNDVLKGVMTSHQGLSNLAQVQQDRFDVKAGDKVLNLAQSGDDVCVFEWLMALCWGAELHLIDNESRNDKDLLGDAVEDGEISHLLLPSSQLSTLDINQFSTVKHLMLRGEPCAGAMAVKWAQNRTLYSVFGPLEACGLTNIGVFDGEKGVLPVGKPISNVQTHVLDKNLIPVPVGVIGELCIGGVGVSGGYYQNPKHSGEKFVVSPDSQERLFKTGELVRWLADGSLAFASNIDRQVQIDGFVIELEEVEHQISAHDKVEKVCVVVGDSEDGPALAAYIVPCDDWDDDEADLVSELNTWCKDSLADQMLPKAINLVEELTKLNNGQVDKALLPAPNWIVEKQYQPPQTPVEVALAKIWVELIDVEQISRTDNYFALGGNSLTAVRLEFAIKEQFKVEVLIKELFENSDLASQAKLIESKEPQSDMPDIVPIARDGSPLPLSFAQQRLWFIDKLNPNSSQYNMPLALELHGELDQGSLQKTLNKVISRHEVLRSVYRAGEDGQAYQVILAVDSMELLEIDVSHLEGDARIQKMKALAEAEAQKPFNLAEDLMMRTCLIKVDDDFHVLLFTMHHIASDGWSFGVLTREFVNLYSAFVQNNPVTMKPLNIQYADFSSWQRDWLSGEVLQQQLDYWTAQLEDLPQTHALALDYKRPAKQSSAGAVIYRQLNPQLSNKLNALSLTNDVTLFMTLQSAFALLIARYSNQKDVVLGTPVANRIHSDLAPLIGFFINNLVMRTNTSGDPSFEGLLARTKTMVLDAFEHQAIPFEMLVDKLQPQRSLSQNPLFQVMFALQNNEAETLTLPGLEVKAVEQEQTVAKFDLTLSMSQTDEGLLASWEYCVDLFNSDTIETLADSFELLLEAIVEHPQLPISKLPVLTRGQIEHLTDELNDTAVPLSTDKLLHEMIEHHARLTPDAIAVAFGEQSLSYRELNEQANILAHCLRAQGVGIETPVGLCLDRSLEMIVSIVAVFKSGGAYVPLDPSYPSERLEYLIQDTGLQHLLTQAELDVELQLPQQMCVTVLDSEQYRQSMSSYASTNLSRLEGQDMFNLIYIIYTSGSTGMPKGVMAEQAGVWNAIEAKYKMQGEAPATLLMPSFAFDASVTAIFHSLCYGGKVCVVPKPYLSDFTLLGDYILSQKVTNIVAVSSFYQYLMDFSTDRVYDSLKAVTVGGDAFGEEFVSQHYNTDAVKQAIIYNEYGPTETSIWCSGAPMAAGSQVTIGPALQNYQLYVLDDDLNLLPEGAVGELFVGGVGVTRGYLNQPEMTAEKFIKNPFSDDSNSRIYRTGDLVRFVADGHLVFMGRADDQVKIRGYRIELSEIDQSLASFEQVGSCLVSVGQDGGDQKQIVAYVKPTNREDLNNDGYIAKLRHQLQGYLPEHMVPSVFVLIDQWPLNPNGKINKKALPSAQMAAVSSQYIEPKGETEQQLAQLWQDMLGLERVGAADNFFEIGGNSLMVIRLVSLINQTFSVNLSVKDVFEHNLLRAQAHLIKRGDTQQWSNIKVVSREQALPLSFAQQRLWFIDQLAPGGAQYNMPMPFRLSGQLNREAMQQALNTIVKRHEVLRTVYQKGSENSAFQIINPPSNFPLRVIDLSDLTVAEREAKVIELAEADAVMPFDLSADLMLRATLVQLAEQEQVLLFNMHHIASDGWSMDILTKEFVTLYSAYAAGRPNPLDALAIQYADFAHWQRSNLTDDVLQQHQDFWSEQLADIPMLHRLPLDKPRPEIQSSNGANIALPLDKLLADQLNRLSIESDTTLFMTLQSVFAILMYRYSHETDIVMGTPVANRGHSDVFELIGFFVNSLVLRNQIDGDLTFTQHLQQAKHVALEAFEHQDIPFEMLVETLQPDRSFSHSPIFQVMFTLQGAQQGEPELPGMTLSGLEHDHLTAKFDLTLEITETEQGLVTNWLYCSDLFLPCTIERMAESFEVLLRAVVDAPQTIVRELPTVSEKANMQMRQWAQVTANYPTDKSIAQLFTAQAKKHPDTVVLICEHQPMTYAQLAEKSNQLAHYLIEKGVKTGDLVGLCVERKPAMVVGMLAILKAGGGYVPMDRDYPESRLSIMIEDADVDFVVTEKATLEMTPCIKSRALMLDDEAAMANYADLGEPQPSEPVKPDNLAYVIFTSGSTGRPKGVMVTQLNVIRLTVAHTFVDIDENDVIAQASNASFDAATFEIWSALLNGAQLQFVSKEELLDVNLLAKIIEESRINTLFLTTALFNQMAQLNPTGYAPLKNLLFGGEMVDNGAVDLIVEHGKPTNLLHVYGPTENTTYSTCYPIVQGGRKTPYPIGKSIDGTYALVLDEQLHVLPIGAIGELVLGGDGVAAGYLNQPELTASTFVKDPLNSQKVAYRTGDLVRLENDGNLVFMGRVDHQVKIRGFRIEPSEIASILTAHIDVDEAHIRVIGEGGDKQLVAYVVFSVKPEDDGNFINMLRVWLSDRCPDYMIPAAFMLLDALPLNPNGKVEVKALPIPDFSELLNANFVEPQSDTEKTLVKIWSELLSIDKISTNVSFFEVGGHSLLAGRLCSRINETFDVNISLMQVFANSTIASLAAVIDAAEKVVHTDITVISKEQPLALSFAQQRLWFIDQLYPGNAQYNMPGAFKLTGKLVIKALQEALDEIVNRHEVLRTVYMTSEDGSALQVIKPATPLEITQLHANSKRELLDLAQADANKSFDLSNDMMLRVSLITVNEDEHVMLFNMHHIASDGWSLGILIQEFTALYSAYTTGQYSPLPQLAIQYADFAHWQRQWLSGEVLEAQLQYWRTQLAGIPQLHSVPLDKVRPKEQSHAGAVYRKPLSNELSAQLEKLSLDNDCTLFMTLQAAYALLLSRYSRETDIVVGTPVANRAHSGLSGLIGFFVNTLVLRNDLSQPISFVQLLAQTKTMALNAYEHQHIPFEMLVEDLQPERSFSHSPLFQVMFTLQNSQQESLQLPNLTLEGLDSGYTVSKFDMTLTMTETETGLVANWEYCTDLFCENTIKGMVKSFEVLLQSIVAAPQTSIHQLALVTTAEHLQLQQWQQVSGDYPRQSTVGQLFSAHAQRQPDAIALADDELTLTYAQADKRSNSLAHLLIERGVKTGDIVGLCAIRTPNLVVAMLAVVKAGAAYVPLDPEHPEERLSYMVDDSKASLVLLDCVSADKLLVFADKALRLDDDNLTEKFIGLGVPTPSEPITPDHLAYVIYTSGSTGKPKGVMISHLNVARLAVNNSYVDIGENDIVSQGANFSFDAAAAEIWVAMLNGCHLQFISKEVMLDPIALGQTIIDKKISTLFVITALFNQVAQVNPAAFKPLKNLMFGGEMVNNSAVDRIIEYGRPGTLLNMYGPAENTTYATGYRIEAGGRQTPYPIGTAVDGSYVMVVDKHRKQLPIGAIGELVVGGDGVAKGYLNRPELTAEVFVDDPNNPGQRVYCSGDLVRMEADGNIVYMGRADNQVKIRGFRIEPGEIAATLTCDERIEEAFILVAGVGSDKKLLAYLIPSKEVPSKEVPSKEVPSKEVPSKEVPSKEVPSKAEPSKAEPSKTLPSKTLPSPKVTDENDFINEIRETLKATMPSYMIPAAFVVLDKLPLTPNGKVDDKALPLPDMAALAKANYVAPSSDTERQLCAIWSQLLGIEAISIEASFFELGGHSLLITRLNSQISKTFSVSLNIRELFENQSIELMAKVIDAAATVVHRDIPVISKDQPLPLSFAQQRLWFIDQLEPGSAQYNMPGAFRLKGVVDKVAMHKAFDTIVERHEVLRTIYQTDDNGHAYQVIQAPRNIEFKVIEADESQVLALAQADACKPFDLGCDLMLRASLIVLNDQDHVMLFNMHHIASDGWSMSVLIEEFIALYTGNAAALKPLAVQYADFAHWQHDWLSGEELERQTKYWENQLADIPQLHSLPLDNKRPSVRSQAGANYRQQLGKTLSEDLNSLSLKSDCTLFMTLQSAFSVLMSRLSNETDVVMGTVVANRQDTALAPMIGFFVNTLVLRSDLSGEPTFNQLLQRNRQVAVDAYQHQDIPFETLVEKLQPQRDFGYSPLFQVMLVLQNTQSGQSEGLKLPGLSIEPIENPHVAAKYDLTISMNETENGLLVNWEYCTDLFLQSSIERMATHFDILLQGIVATPDQPVTELDMLTQAQTHQLMVDFNDTETDYDKTAVIHELFEARVAEAPQAEAVRFEGQSLTYQQLNERANQVAHYLVGQGIKPDMLVGLHVDRSFEMIIGILGIVKAGGAYVPLDSSYPHARLKFIVEDSAIELLLTQQHLLAQSDFYSGPKTCLDKLSPMATTNIAKETLGLTSNNLAFVIYTSGSTGQPKGALLEHHGLVNLSASQRRIFEVKSTSRLVQFASLSFDGATFEWVKALTNGAALQVVSKEVIQSAKLFGDMVQTEQVTHGILPPAFLPHLDFDKLKSMTNLVVAGEHCPIALARTWAKDRKFYNMYGLSEVSAVSTVSTFTEGDDVLSIGRPLDNTTLYVVNESMQLAPVGTVGELYIGGDGLGREYLNLPQINALRFVSNPFGEGRLYRTGDWVKWMPDGQLEYVGRIDNQIKLRGFRIELDEIISTIDSHPQIFQATVVVSGEGLEKRLVAYIVPEKDVETQGQFIEGLRHWLSKRIPAHMVPALFMLIDEIPRTTNGKVNRRALPEPDLEALMAQSYAAPANVTEQALCAIWAEVLGVDKVGVDDNFFSIGGDSIRVIQILKKAEAHNIYLTVKDVFVHQTVAALADFAVNNVGQRGSSEPAPMHLLDEVMGKSAYMTDGVEDVYPVTGMQQLVLRNHGIKDVESGIYHPNMLIEINGKAIDASQLQKVLMYIVAKNPTFRTEFVERGDGTHIQRVLKNVQVPLSVVDFTGMREKRQHQETATFIDNDRAKPFKTGEIGIRFSLIQYQEKKYGFYISAHHAIFDGSALTDSCAEMIDLYDKLDNGQSLPVLTDTCNVYKEHVALELEARTDETVQQAWVALMSNYQPMPELEPIKKPKLKKDNQLLFGIEQSKAQKLIARARLSNVPLKTLLLLAYKRALASVLDTNTVTVDVVTSGRSSRLSDIAAVGLFWNLLPVCTRMDVDDDVVIADLSERLLNTDIHALYSRECIKGETYAAFNYVNMITPESQPSDSEESTESEFDDLSFKVVHTSDRFDYAIKMKINAETTEGRINGGFEFDRRYFTEKSVKSLGKAFGKALTALVEGG